nr:MAG TPA: hypothetical protein [Caudoviricetes sp.]
MKAANEQIWCLISVKRLNNITVLGAMVPRLFIIIDFFIAKILGFFYF